MNIGIVLTSYQSIQHIEKCLEAWIKQKENNKEHSFYIAINSGMFKESYENHINNNIPIPEDDGSLAYVKELEKNKKIDYVFTHNGLDEASARNGALKFLLGVNKDIQLIWIVDSDEYYTVEDIDKIIKFIEKKSDTSYYRVNFKNYIGRDKYILDFNPPRIFWTFKNGGIKEFYYDNDIIYRDGRKSAQYDCITIPSNYVKVEHHSWDGNAEQMKNKIEYQYKHFGEGNCSYKWDDEHNRLIFDEEFYKRFGLTIPFVYEDKIW